MQLPSTRPPSLSSSTQCGRCHAGPWRTLRGLGIGGGGLLGALPLILGPGGMEPDRGENFGRAGRRGQDCATGSGLGWIWTPAPIFRPSLAVLGILGVPEGCVRYHVEQPLWKSCSGQKLLPLAQTSCPPGSVPTICSPPQPPADTPKATLVACHPPHSPQEAQEV